VKIIIFHESAMTSQGDTRRVVVVDLLEGHRVMLGSGWSHSLCLIELFPDLTNFLKFHSQGASQQKSKSGVMFCEECSRFCPTNNNEMYFGSLNESQN
jgi:hypothetical protein